MKNISSIIIIIVVSISVFTWFVSIWQYDTMMSSMMTFYYSPVALSLFAIIWTAGMAAMMFPAIIPMILFYNRLIDSSTGSKDNSRFNHISQMLYHGQDNTRSDKDNNNNNTAGLNINNINQLFRSNEISKIKDIEAKQQSSQLQQESEQKQQQKYFANIMVVDDEPDALFTYKCLLSVEGYNVEAFTDPQEALKHFVQLPDPSSYYHLVLLDIRMPRLNGLQLYNTIKTLSPNTKIMFVSALDMAEELTSILPNMKYGDIIRKPVEREYFISKINSMLNN